MFDGLGNPTFSTLHLFQGQYDGVQRETSDARNTRMQTAVFFNGAANARNYEVKIHRSFWVAGQCIVYISHKR